MSVLDVAVCLLSGVVVAGLLGVVLILTVGDRGGSPVTAEEPQEEIVAHTSRVLTTSQAAREWDSMTQPTTRTMVILPPDEDVGV